MIVRMCERTEDSVPNGEESAEVAIVMPAQRAMVHTMHRRRDDDIPKELLDTRWQPNIRMLELCSK